MSTIVKIIMGDITKLKVDGIVNGVNPNLIGGGTVDAAIHKAAGPNLMEELKTLGPCKTGEAKISGGHDLLAKKIIHTVPPVWIDGNSLEEEDLTACYKSALELAVRNKLKSLAFPAIGTGAFRFPLERAFKVALESIRKFTRYSEGLDEIYIVAFNQETFEMFKKHF
jgi:O-acetyl-ADP-ribose deacetylase